MRDLTCDRTLGQTGKEYGVKNGKITRDDLMNALGQIDEDLTSDAFWADAAKNKTKKRLPAILIPAAAVLLIAAAVTGIVAGRSSGNEIPETGEIHAVSTTSHGGASEASIGDPTSIPTPVHTSALTSASASAPSQEPTPTIPQDDIAIVDNLYFRYNASTCAYTLTAVAAAADGTEIRVPAAIGGVPVSSIDVTQIPEGCVLIVGNSVTELPVSVYGNVLKKNILFSEDAHYAFKDGCLIALDNGILLVGDDGAVIPEGVVVIAAYAFQDKHLTKITLPDSVTTIGNGAFSGSTVEEVICGAGLRVIGEKAFYNCYFLNKITLPAGLSRVGYNAFVHDTQLTEVRFEGTPADWCGVVFNSVTASPMYEGNAALYIEGKKLDDLVIPEGVETIGTAAFYKCRSLTGVKIPQSVRSVGKSAFEGCENMRGVYYEGTAAQWCGISFGTSVLTYADLYIGGTVLRHADLSAGVQAVSACAFDGCGTLESVILPEGLQTIGSSAFRGTRLKSVVIPEGVTEIPNNAFASCSQLETVVLPEGITRIGNGAFSQTAVRNVVFPSTITSVGDNAFSYCMKLEEIVLLPWMKLGNNAFQHCSGLKSLSVPRGVNAPGNAFTDCYQLDTVIFEDPGIANTGSFEGCRALKNVVFAGTEERWQSISKSAILTGAATVYRNLETLPVSLAEGGEFTYNGTGYTLTGMGTCTETDVVIPSVYAGEPVTGVVFGAFAHAVTISSVTVPQSVTHFDNGTFNIQLAGLKLYYEGTVEQWLAISFPLMTCNPCAYGAVLYIGNEPLKEVILPEGTRTVGYALYNIRTLERIVIPASVERIDAAGWSESLNVYYEGTVAQWCAIEYESYTCNPCSRGGKLFIGGAPLPEDLVIPEGTEKIGNCAFAGIGTIRSVVIPGSVRTVGDYAFQYCASLETVVLGEGVETVGNYTFFCDAIEEIRIPASVKELGAGAFANCGALSGVTLGSGMTAVPDGCFENCEALLKITLPERIVSIGAEAFKNTGLVDVVIPDSVTSVGKHAFDTVTLRTVKIGNGLTTLDNCFRNMFSEFVYLDLLTFGPGIRYIMKDTFLQTGVKELRYEGTLEDWATIWYENSWAHPVRDQTKLFIGGVEFSGDPVIPDGTVEIADNAFKGQHLKTITIPKSVKRIGENVFAECYELEAIYYEGTLADWCAIEFGFPGVFAGQKTVLYVGGEPVYDAVIPDGTETIGDYAFIYYKQLKSVTIPGSVTKIGDSAFKNCPRLRGVTIPGNVEVIGQQAFCNCENLRTVELEEGIAVIEDGAFYGCKTLKSIEIPGSVVSVGDSAFCGCRNLTSVVFRGGTAVTVGDSAFEGCSILTVLSLGETATSIGKKAFYGCVALPAVSIPDSVVTVGENAFNGCKNLTDVTMGKGLDAIGDGAFGNCAALKNVIFGENLTSIGNGAFTDCSAIETLELGDRITVIGENAFKNCTALYVLTVPDGVVTIGYRAFFGCTALVGVSVGKNVTEIGERAFENCTSLAGVKIGDGVTAIGKFAFLECASLHSIEIGKNVKSIGFAAFVHCTSLTDVTLPESLTDVGDNAFEGCTALSSVKILGSRITVGAKAFYDCIALKKVYFAGDPEQWAEISQTTGNDSLVRAEVVYGYSGDH